MTDITSPNRIAAGRIINISQSGICADVAVDFPIGAVVKLQLVDSTLFGHITYCRPGADAYQIGIEVVRVLIGDSDLARLINSILVEAIPQTPGIKPVSPQ